MRSRWKNSYISPALYYSFIYDWQKDSFLFLEKSSSLSSRSTTILPFFLHKILFLSDGKKHRSLYVDHNMLGHKIGEFISTRVRCVYRRKKKKKKKNDKSIIYYKCGFHSFSL